MKFIIASTILISSIFYPLMSFSTPDSSTEIDWNADISDIALDLVNIHKKLGEEAQANGNTAEAQYHFKLAGIGASEMAKLIQGKKLDEQEKEKIIKEGPGNCYLKQAIATCYK